MVFPYELSANEISDIVYVCVERVGPFSGLDFRSRSVSTVQWFIYDVPRGIPTRQAKVYEKVTGRTPSPSVSSRFAFEVSIPIALDWVETCRVHFRRFKHDVVRCAVPMGHVMLMHKLEALAYLSKECDEFAKGLKSGTVERAQKWEYYDFVRFSALQLDEVQKRCTVITRVVGKFWG